MRSWPAPVVTYELGIKPCSIHDYIARVRAERAATKP